MNAAGMSSSTPASTPSGSSRGSPSGRTTPSGRVRVGASPASVLFLAILSFGAGGLAGALGYHQYTCRCDEADWARTGTSWKADFSERWTHELELTADQRKRLEAIVDEFQPRYRALYGDLRPRKTEIDRDLQARVREFLSEPQRARYDEALARDAERRKAYYGALDASAIAKPVKPPSDGPSN